MKINVSYDEFDNLIETIDNTPVPEDYNFPTVEEAEELLVDLPGMTLVLFAAEKSNDKEYSKALNDLIKEKVDFIEEEDAPASEIDLYKINNRVDSIMSKIKLMDFQFPCFCPSKAEIDMIASKNLAKDDVALGFLIWVSMQGDSEDAPDNIKEISKYTKKVLESAQKYA